jgi:hypothetical protein
MQMFNVFINDFYIKFLVYGKCVNTEMLIVLIGICRHFHLFFGYVVCTKKTLDSYKELIVNYTPAPRRERGVYCFTSVRLSVRPRYFSSHFSQ